MVVSVFVVVAAVVVVVVAAVFSEAGRCMS